MTLLARSAVAVTMLLLSGARAADTFSVTDRVAVENPPRFGMNFRSGSLAAWSTGIKINDWVGWAQFEPFVTTFYGICTGGTPTTLVHEGRNGGLSYWNSMHDDFYTGGSCDVYRIVDGELQHIRTAGIKKFEAGPAEQSANTVTFTEPGPTVMAGDIYVLRQKMTRFPIDHMAERMKRTHLAKVFGGPMGKYNEGDMDAYIDESTAAPEGGSTGSLKMHVTKAESWKPVGIWQAHIMGNPTRIKFQEGEDYTFQVWLKQEGMESGKVKIKISSFFETEVEVTDKWQKFEFDFPTTTRVQWGQHTLAKARELGTLDAATMQMLEQWATRLKNNYQELVIGPPSLVTEVAARGGEVAYYKELLAELQQRANVLMPNVKKTGLKWLIEKTPEEIKKVEAFAREVNKLGDRVVHEGPMKNAAKRTASAIKGIEMRIRKTFYTEEMEALREKLRPRLANYPEVAELFAKAEATQLMEDYYGNDSMFYVGAVENGTLWLDNMGIFQKGTEPFAVLPVWKEALREFKPGHLRMWAGLYYKGMHSWMKTKWQKTAVAWQKGVRAPGQLSLFSELDTAREAGADPWLIAWPLNPDAEVEDFMEYLAAPADVGYGKVRARHGQERPWTEEFDEIYIEAGNEMWNNMMTIQFSGQPEIVARISDYLFRQIKSSPYYDPDKFKLVINGFGLSTKPDGWSHKIARYTKEADTIDFAHYYGGWDGFTPIGQDDEDLFSRQMMYCPHVVENQMIHSMNEDKALPGKMGTIFSEQPALRKRFLSVMKPATRQRDVPVAEGVGADIMATLTDLIKNDPKLNDAVNGSLSLWNRDLQQLGVKAVIEAAENDPALQKMLSNIFGLTPEQTMKIIPAAVGHNTHMRIVLGKALHENPEIGKRLLALFEGEWKYNHEDHQPKLIDEVERCMKGDFKIGYFLINRFRHFVIPGVVEQIKNNPQAAASVPKYLSQTWSQEQAKDLNGRVQQMIDRMSERFSAIVKNNMLNDPAFAEAVLDRMQTDGEHFMQPAIDAIMPVVRDEIWSTFSPQSLLNTKERANKKSMALLPESVRKGIAAKVMQGAELDPSPFYPLVADLTKASLESITGNGKALEQVLQSPALKKRVAESAAYGLSYDMLEPMLDDAALARRFQVLYNRLPRDRVLERAVYESGPGYQLPGPGKQSPEQDEKMGKSMAIGIVTLDTFLYNQFLDFGPQAYYEMKTGDYWSSHKSMNEMIPYPSVLVLQMRNRYCEGDLLYVDYTDVKTIDIPEQEVYKTSTSGKKTSRIAPGRNNIPLANCYAYRKNDRYSFIMFNRSFTEPREVSLELPYDPASQVDIYKMEPDNPRIGNRYEYNIKIEKETRRDFENGYTITLQPGSACVLVNRSR